MYQNFNLKFTSPLSNLVSVSPLMLPLFGIRFLKTFVHHPLLPLLERSSKPISTQRLILLSSFSLMASLWCQPTSVPGLWIGILLLCCCALESTTQLRLSAIKGKLQLIILISWIRGFLACLSKSVAHILQRELYTMGNTGLLRREAEMTLLQPHLGDSRRQELRNSPFWPTPLFKSQLVKNGEDFFFKKGTPKDSQGFGPYQNKPFCGPHHNKKRGSYRKRPYWGNSSQSSNQSFTSGRGKPNFRGSRGRFRPHSRGRGHGNPSSQWLLSSLPQSTSRRLPPFFQQRLAHKQVFRQHFKHYHQWLHSSIHLKTKFSQEPL